MTDFKIIRICFGCVHFYNLNLLRTGHLALRPDQKWRSSACSFSLLWVFNVLKVRRIRVIHWSVLSRGPLKQERGGQLCVAEQLHFSFSFSNFFRCSFLPRCSFLVTPSSWSLLPPCRSFFLVALSDIITMTKHCPNHLPGEQSELIIFKTL